MPRSIPVQLKNGFGNSDLLLCPVVLRAIVRPIWYLPETELPQDVFYFLPGGQASEGLPDLKIGETSQEDPYLRLNRGGKDRRLLKYGFNIPWRTDDIYVTRNRLWGPKLFHHLFDSPVVFIRMCIARVCSICSPPSAIQYTIRVAKVGVKRVVVTLSTSVNDISEHSMAYHPKFLQQSVVLDLTRHFVLTLPTSYFSCFQGCFDVRIARPIGMSRTR